MAQAKYFDAPEVADMAQKLIAKYHQHLIDYSVRIRYVFVDKTPNSQGKEVWGTCRKISGLNAYLEGENVDGEPFFVITISKDIWDVLPPDKRLALVDHELCHAWAEAKQQKNESDDDSDMETDNPVKLNIKPHDLEEFSCIVRRHGLWREDIEAFVDEALKCKNQTQNPTNNQ
jgi:hypothetical protein